MGIRMKTAIFVTLLFAIVFVNTIKIESSLKGKKSQAKSQPPNGNRFHVRTQPASPNPQRAVVALTKNKKGQPVTRPVLIKDDHLNTKPTRPILVVDDHLNTKPNTKPLIHEEPVVNPANLQPRTHVLVQTKKTHLRGSKGRPIRPNGNPQVHHPQTAPTPVGRFAQLNSKVGVKANLRGTMKVSPPVPETRPLPITVTRPEHHHKGEILEGHFVLEVENSYPTQEIHIDPRPVVEPPVDTHHTGLITPIHPDGHNSKPQIHHEEELPKPQTATIKPKPQTKPFVNGKGPAQIKPRPQKRPLKQKIRRMRGINKHAK